MLKSVNPVLVHTKAVDVVQACYKLGLTILKSVWSKNWESFLEINHVLTKQFSSLRGREGSADTSGDLTTVYNSPPDGIPARVRVRRAATTTGPSMSRSLNDSCTYKTGTATQQYFDCAYGPVPDAANCVLLMTPALPLEPGDTNNASGHLKV